MSFCPYPNQKSKIKNFVINLKDEGPALAGRALGACKLFRLGIDRRQKRSG
jgi:hypothetical protein